MPRSALFSFAPLLFLAACDDAATESAACQSAGGCSASPFGTWELACSEPPKELTYSESTFENGTAVTRSCSMQLRDNDLVARETLTLSENGTFNRVWSFAGTWSGVAGVNCSDDMGLACQDIASLPALGLRSCSVEADGCHCEGMIDRKGTEAGSAAVGSRTITLTADGLAPRTFEACTGTSAMALTLADEGDTVHYRRVDDKR